MVSTTISMDEDLKELFSSCFLMRTYLIYDNIVVNAPTPTRKIPMKEEYPC